MPTRPLTVEQMREAVEAVAAHGSLESAATALGLSPGALRNRYVKGVKAGLDEAIVHPAPQGHTVKGVSTLYGPDGQVLTQWVKTRTDGPSLDDIIGAVRDAFAEYEPPPKLETAPDHADADLATIIPLADFHLGLLTWGKETGTDWDLSIAQDIIRRSMHRLMQASPASSQAVILGLGDLLHSDGYAPITSRSKNNLDVDGRWPKVLKVAVELVIHAVDLALMRHDSVLVRILPGNHDDESAIAVALALGYYYSNNPRVSVDDDPSRFWWWTWGSSLLGATHGDMAKMKDLPLLMAARNPEAWGKAKFRAVYTGHIHQQTGIELSGVTVESFQTPAPPDAWATGMGYYPGRSLTAITLHRSDGEVSRVRAAIIAN